MPDDEQTRTRKAWGARVRAERRERGWDKPEMAAQLAAALTGTRPSLETLISYIKRWEPGHTGISERYQLAYARAFHVDPEALFADDRSLPAFEDEAEVERRRLLQDLAALGVAVSPAANALRSIRLALETALHGAAEHTVSDWEELAAEYGYAFLTTPAAELLQDLAVDMVAIQQRIKRASNEAERRDLCQPGGQMAMLMALTIGSLGSKREARHWWQTARHIADASADKDLRVWVRGYEAMQGLYEKRPPALVLRRADEAIAIAGDGLHPAVLEAMAARAQTLASLGRAADAEAAVTEMEIRFARIPASTAHERMSPRHWPETGLRHTKSWVLTHTGNRGAAPAQDVALALYPPQMQRQITQIRLLQANTLVRNGDVAGGIEHARAVLEALPAEQQTIGIRQGAHAVLALVPDSEHARPAVSEFREQLALPQGT